MTEENNTADVKLWNGTKCKVHLGVTFSGKKGRMGIGKDVIRVLGGPRFVCVRVTEIYDSFIVQPTNSKEYMSFKVPDGLLLVGDMKMNVTSKAFVRSILSKNGLEVSQTYTLEGTYSEKNNAVVFRMIDVRPYWEADYNQPE